MMALIRQYQENDISPLVDILSQLTPSYFHQSEIADYQYYLEHEIEQYFVLEEAGKILGGGINFFQDGMEARISWDLIHPHWHGKGLGKMLLNHRISLIKKRLNVKQVVVRTTQHAYVFYQKSGFEIKQTIKDYWASGYDLVLMEYNLKLPANSIACND